MLVVGIAGASFCWLVLPLFITPEGARHRRSVRADPCLSLFSRQFGSGSTDFVGGAPRGIIVRLLAHPRELIVVPSRFRRTVLPAALVVALIGLIVTLTTTMIVRGRVDTSNAPVYKVPLPPPLPAPLNLPEQPRVLLMGDSYSEGWGAEPKSEGFAFHIAEPLGWRLTRDGIGSTGYVDAGLKNQGNYPARLMRHPADAYDLVILQGGTNDEKLSATEITAGVDTTVRVVRERFPRAQLLVMGPVAPYGTPSDDRANLNFTLADYTSQQSILYINTIAEHWFQPGEWRTLVNESKGHPNNAGYQRVAERFVADIRALQATQTLPAR